jgi:integrase
MLPPSSQSTQFTQSTHAQWTADPESPVGSDQSTPVDSRGGSDAAQRLAAIIVAAIDLGARVGELLALQWRDILFDFGRVSVRAVEAGARKNRKPRQVPLTPRVVEWLRKLQAAAPTEKGWLDTDYVFGDTIGGRVTKIRKAWVNLRPAR